MHSHDSSRALSFSGKATELLEVFEDFEDSASSCALTDREKCRMILEYVNLATKQFWMGLQDTLHMALLYSR